jgi:hypothetical protein
LVLFIINFHIFHRRYVMSQPVRGQPFTAAPGLRFSIGDPFADEGTVAFQGVVVGAPPFDAPPPNIVPVGTPITLTIFLRDADALGGVFLDPAITTAFVNYHITNVENNTFVGTFGGGAIVGPLPAAGIAIPAGASAPAVGEVVQWYAAVSPPIALPAPGATYRALAHVHGTGPFITAFGGFHDHTYFDTRP